MPSRIVVFGATGYTGRLTAERLVAQGERPLLAGRSESRLSELAERLGGQEWRLADVDRPETVAALLAPGDVLLTTVGPFKQWGEPALRAAIAAGGVYIDSTGEPAFIRRVFDEHGPPARPCSRRRATPRCASTSATTRSAADRRRSAAGRRRRWRASRWTARSRT